MIKTVKQAYRFNPVIKDYWVAQGIENLADLNTDVDDGRDVFARNNATHGMEQLLREGMLHLSGKFDQGIFELSQEMDGGKTNMIMVVMPSRYSPIVCKLCVR
ncbi:MAG: hypothetical protein U9Q75_06605 [Pseudomonadota bacterium]|nr:hypothetical protein [Pseudomonadota bacterium]